MKGGLTTPWDLIKSLEEEKADVERKLDEAHRAYGRWLRHYRQISGDTLRTFAKKLGISAPYLHDIEAGNRKASPRVRELIAKRNV